MMFAPHDRLGWDSTIYLRDEKLLVRMKHVDWAVAPRVEAEAGVKGAAEYIDGEEDEDVGAKAPMPEPKPEPCWAGRLMAEAKTPPEPD